MVRKRKAGYHWLHLSSTDLKRYAGRVDALAGATMVTYQDGKSYPSRGVNVYTGSGLEFTVYIDRCMDISQATYKGIPLGWRSTVGDVAPFYYEPEGIRWLRSYFGGLMTTCGLTNVGPPCEQSELTGDGLHGRISNIPAEDVCVEKQWVGSKYMISIRGKMRQTALFAEHLVLERRVKTYLGATSFTIEDTVTNEGYRRTPFMILYHCNIGWPVVSENAVVCIPARETIPRDEVARKGRDPWYVITSPVEYYRERVYFHDVQTRRNDVVWVGIYHPRADLAEDFYGVYIKYDKKQLKKFVQWKMLGCGEYVIGLEPCNVGVLGREETMRRGEMDYLMPGEIRHFQLEIGIIDEKNKDIFYRIYQKLIGKKLSRKKY